MNKQMITLLDSANVTLDKNSNSEYKYNNIVVPRVTEIISKHIHSDGLMYWANSLGFKRKSYKKTLEESSEIGTNAHESIDKFLEFNINCDPYFDPQASNAYKSFKKWWDDIHTCNNIKIIYHEHTLVCKYFGGTLDGLYEINGKLYIVDYKTSNHVTYRYFLQIAAYRYMLREVYDIYVDGCIVLQLSKYDVSYNEYVLNFDIKEHLDYINNCEMAFMSMVFTYYNICNIENGFNNINWG